MRISLVTPPRRSVAGIATVLAGVILLGAGPSASWTTPAAVNLGAVPFAVLAKGGIIDMG